MGARIYINGQLVGNSTDQFLRQTFSLASVAQQGELRAEGNDLTVVFDNSVFTDGRFMACSGGWDWAAYSNQQVAAQPGTTSWFTRGIWKSVYTVDIAASDAAITHLVPHTYYQGDYPVGPLAEHTHGGFEVRVRVHLHASTTGTKGTVTVKGAWGTGQSASQEVTLHQGENNVTLVLQAAAKDILLWWPANLGEQPRYQVSASFTPAGNAAQVPILSQAVMAGSVAAPIEAQRQIGFRYAVIVTGNDTDPEYVKASKDADGGSQAGMFFRVNGAAVYARGANMIPIEELEGRRNSSALRQMVASAVDGGFNILRVWGGGIFQDQPWYDACDELGILVYHDLQYAQKGHSPGKTATQEAEYRHQIRRLSHHPSIILIDGCNECAVIIGTPTGIYASFSLTIVAEEDDSRALWPSCPSAGWASGVNRLSGAPNGSPKGLVPAEYKSPENPAQQFGQNTHLEVHGPYQHSGSADYQYVNGPNNIDLPPTFIPPKYSPASKYGVGQPNQFASEFGAVTLQSFESMTATLAPEHWGIHGGAPSDTCGGGFAKSCKGDNVMAQRNYPMDGMIEAFFGKQDFNATGEGPFKQQCYQSMIAQALNIKGEVEQQRSKNMFGTITWQYGEIWPTGGWGSVEYSTPVAGQVMGGRWKPLQYWYRASIYADVMAACGADSTCYVRNDFPFDFQGHLTVKSVSLKDGTTTALHDAPLSLAAGPGTVNFFHANVSTVSTTGSVIIATVTQSSAQRAQARTSEGRPSPRLVPSVSAGGTDVVSANVQLLSTPGTLAVQPSGLKASVAKAPNADGTVDITLTGNNVAVYATLTTLAHGRFSDNAFVFTPPSATVQFVPFKGATFDMEMLTSSLRVEDLSSYQ